MVRSAAEVIIRSVERHRGRQRSLSGRWSGKESGRGRYQVGGVVRSAAEVVIRSVEWHRGRQRSLSGRWSGTEGGRGHHQVGEVITEGG